MNFVTPPCLIIDLQRCGDHHLVLLAIPSSDSVWCSHFASKVKELQKTNPDLVDISLLNDFFGLRPSLAPFYLWVSTGPTEPHFSSCLVTVAGSICIVDGSIQFHASSFSPAITQ